jgi:DNA-binding NtrC family response regulator
MKKMNNNAKASILIVDDEVNLRKTLAMILAREGYTVTTVNNVQEARECLHSASFSLMFLDLKMPGENGLTLLPELHQRHPSMPVLVLTAHDNLDAALEAVHGGARDYLLKPVDPTVIIQRVREVLGEKS